MGFDDAERSEATQVLELSEEDYKDDGLIPLRYVKFQNVQSVTVRTSIGDNSTKSRSDRVKRKCHIAYRLCSNAPDDVFLLT